VYVNVCLCVWYVPRVIRELMRATCSDLACACACACVCVCVCVLACVRACLSLSLGAHVCVRYATNTDTTLANACTYLITTLL